MLPIRTHLWSFKKVILSQQNEHDCDQSHAHVRLSLIDNTLVLKFTYLHHSYNIGKENAKHFPIRRRIRSAKRWNLIDQPNGLALSIPPRYFLLWRTWSVPVVVIVELRLVHTNISSIFSQESYFQLSMLGWEYRNKPFFKQGIFLVMVYNTNSLDLSCVNKSCHHCATSFNSRPTLQKLWLEIKHLFAPRF